MDSLWNAYVTWQEHTISFYVCVHIKQYPENFAFFILKNLELFALEVCKFRKKILPDFQICINVPLKQPSCWVKRFKSSTVFFMILIFAALQVHSSTYSSWRLCWRILAKLHKFVFFQYFLIIVGIHFLQNWESEFPIYGENIAKQKHSKIKGFLNISREAEIHAILKAWDEWVLIVWEKYGEKQTFQNYELLNISCEAEIHAIPKPRDEWISILRNKYGKTRSIPRFCCTS